MTTLTKEIVLAHAVDHIEKEGLEKLRQLLKDEKSLVCPLDDAYLLRFLRYQNGDYHKAHEAVMTWWKTRKAFPIVHDEIRPNLYMKHRKFFYPLKHKDGLGRQVIIAKAREWDPSIHSAMEMFRSTFIMMDTILDAQHTQLNGLVAIVDLQGLNFGHMRAYTVSDVRTVLAVIHVCPLKIKGIHFINNPLVFNTMWNVVKLFLKPKLKKRVTFHGHKYHESLHGEVERKVLPKEYGGEMDDEDSQNEELVKIMMGKDEYFRDLMDPKKTGLVGE